MLYTFLADPGAVHDQLKPGLGPRRGCWQRGKGGKKKERGGGGSEGNRIELVSRPFWLISRSPRPGEGGKRGRKKRDSPPARPSSPAGPRRKEVVIAAPPASAKEKKKKKKKRGLNSTASTLW